MRFELSPGTGEWITSHIAVSDESGHAVRQIVRTSVLKAMFGSSSKGFQGMLDLVQRALEDHLAEGSKLEQFVAPLEGFVLTPLQVAHARNGRIHALRMAARQSTALCSMDDLDEPADIETAAEDESGTWITRVRDLVTNSRPDLSLYFDRHGMLYSETVRFGFLTDEVGAHFGSIAPNSVATSMRITRGKLQELRVGARTMQLRVAKLVAAVPGPDDIQWTERQLEATKRATEELRQEAEECKIPLAIAHTVQQAADSVLALVD